MPGRDMACDHPEHEARILAHMARVEHEEAAAKLKPVGHKCRKCKATGQVVRCGFCGSRVSAKMTAKRAAKAIGQ